MPAAIKDRLAWEDRFRTPTLEQLRAPLNKQLQGAFDAARDRLLEFEGLSESILWRGIPWRWTVAFTSQDDREGWAYLVPQPARPYLVLPVAIETLSKLPVRRLSKFVREGILHAACVAGVYWPQWDIQTKGQVEDVFTVVAMKHAALQPQA